MEQFQAEDEENYEQELESFKESLPTIEEAPFKYRKQELVICCDTLSQDREFGSEERKQVEAYCRLLGESWEDMHRRLLSQDVDD